ncbi:hypothetical protein [Dyella sp. 2HG41-7]|uniref:hypothetical protein n=1 Tax=Dyella sp. 2HG41-7 TaxID=2883239 RepID=UPI001F29197A|nr:hypothetical protein [Dyella sp. 2HG41-7]
MAVTEMTIWIDISTHAFAQHHQTFAPLPMYALRALNGYLSTLQTDVVGRSE